MIEDLEKLPEGSSVIVSKNADGTFSPLYMSKEQGICLNSVMATLSDEKPFIMDVNIKLKIMEKEDGQ